MKAEATRVSRWSAARKSGGEQANPSDPTDHVEAVHHKIRQAILHGEIQPGSEISQVQLAKELGVSRTPLREALRMLVFEGLIDAEPNRSMRVAGYSIPDLDHLYMMRIALETTALRLTMTQLSPEDIGAFEGILAEMSHFAALRDYERWEVPHRRFHRGLSSTGGDRLRNTIAQLSDHTERYRRLYTTTQQPQGWSAGIDEHRTVLDAVKRGDAEGAVRALATHLAHTAFGVIARIEPNYTPTAVNLALLSVGVDPKEVAAAAW